MSEGKLSAGICKSIAEDLSLKRQQQVFLSIVYRGSKKISLSNKFTEIEDRSQAMHPSHRKGLWISELKLFNRNYNELRFLVG